MKKRTLIFKYFMLGIIIEYCMYLIAGSWGGTIYEILPKLEKVMSNPLGWYFNKYTIIFLLIGIGITFIWYLFDITKPAMMPGKEYGTAQWGNIRSIEKRMIEKGNVKEIRQYSENFKISTNSDFTGCNNNVFIVGGSGTRKSWSGLQPNIWLENGSMLITDPKGELLARNGKKLIQDGYVVRVLDLIDMKLSDRYNPFSYIRESADIPRMVNCIIRSTSPSEMGKKKTGGDPFWENSESLFLQALFYYVWMEEPECNRSMRRVMELLSMAKYSDDGIPSDLDEIMYALSIKKKTHPAVRKYNEVMGGAGDTVRSVIISVHVRMALFEEEDVLRIFDADDFQIGTFGAGINMDGKTKTAVFIKIPDNDKTYNFIASMFYMQACRELYRLADRVYHGKLPIHVSFWFDEFANIALPDDIIDRWIATCRSRNLSCIIIIQNLAQIKAMYDKKWDTIPGNCDVLLYLGGNEQETHEYISKLLGKQTIYKRNSSETRGSHGSSSRTLDVLGRDLMTADEVGSLSNEKCIIKVRGCYPIIDNKYIPFNKANFALIEKLGVYEHKPIRDNQYFKILTPQELEACERDALLMPDRIQITSMTIEELCRLVEIAKQQVNQDHHFTIKNIPFRQTEKIVHNEQKAVYKGNSLTDILSKYILDDGKMNLIKKGVSNGLNDEQIICMLNKSSEEWENYLTLFKEMNARKVAN